LGGLGKTQLAVEYAYLFRDQYPNCVRLLNADQDLDAQMIKIAEGAGWVATESEHKDKLAIAQQRLRTHSHCLVLFDNLEKSDTFRDYLPDPGAEPHVLVTSRVDQPDFVPLPLDLLDTELSVQLLTQEAGQSPRSDGSLEGREQAESRLARLFNLPKRELFRSTSEIVAEAYRLQGERIAYQEDALALREEPPKYGD
jgi:hypothetical protein